MCGGPQGQTVGKAEGIRLEKTYIEHGSTDASPGDMPTFQPRSICPGASTLRPRILVVLSFREILYEKCQTCHPGAVLHNGKGRGRLLDLGSGYRDVPGGTSGKWPRCGVDPDPQNSETAGIDTRQCVGAVREALNVVKYFTLSNPPTAFNPRRPNQI